MYNCNKKISIDLILIIIISTLLFYCRYDTMIKMAFVYSLFFQRNYCIYLVSSHSTISLTSKINENLQGTVSGLYPK